MSASSAPIDLTTALPPSPPELETQLRLTLAKLATTEGIGAAIRQNRVDGASVDREAGAAWLATRLGPGLSADRVVVTNGTQSALMLLFQALVRPGELIAAEALTYVVLRTIVARLGIEIAGVALDEHGVVPEAFEQLCRVRRPRLLYCNPTIHNPTAVVMPEARRAELAAIARRHGVLIVEDDVLGAIHPEAPPPIAAVAPDITWYVMSLSKCFAMGLRMAYLVAPTTANARQLVEPVRRLSSWFPNSLSAEIVQRWIRSGAGRRIAAAIRAEADARQTIAADILHGLSFRSAPGALHLWLQLPAGWTAERFAEAARQRDVLVRAANLFAVDTHKPPECIRISVTGPGTQTELRAGLSVLASLLIESHQGVNS